MAKRLSRTDYFDTALDMLAKGGLSSVTLANLCEALNVTRGSFYYHFESISDFMHKLLQYWSEGVESISIDWSKYTAEQILSLVHDRSIYSLNHEAEREIRAYGRTTPETNEIISRVDAGRRGNIKKSLVKAGVAEETAEAIGHIGIALFIAEQQRVPIDRGALKSMYDEYLVWAMRRLHEAVDTKAAKS